jgi:hypothetical protein
VLLDSACDSHVIDLLSRAVVQHPLLATGCTCAHSSWRGWVSSQLSWQNACVTIVCRYLIDPPTDSDDPRKQYRSGCCTGGGPAPAAGNGSPCSCNGFFNCATVPLQTISLAGMHAPAMAQHCHCVLMLLRTCATASHLAATKALHSFDLCTLVLLVPWRHPLKGTHSPHARCSAVRWRLCSTPC